MTGGVTVSGDIVFADASEGNPALEIEIEFEDENFLPRVANKNPVEAVEALAEEDGALENAIKGFLEGAYSWPFDYTLGIHWVAACSGLYGSQIQANAFYHGDRILTVLNAARLAVYYLIFKGLLFKFFNSGVLSSMDDLELDFDLNEDGADLRLDTDRVDIDVHADREAVERAAREAWNEFQKHMPNMNQTSNSVSRIAGRKASGSFFTKWMQNRIGRLTRNRSARTQRIGKKGIGWTNTALLSIGSAVHTSHKNPMNLDLVKIFIGWISGDHEFEITNEEYSAMFRSAMNLADALGDSLSDSDDYKLYVEFVQEVFGLMEGEMK